MFWIRKLVAAGFTVCVSVAISLAAIFLVAILWLIGSSDAVQASEHYSAYPHMIVCDFKEVRYFGYLDRIEADGRAYYITPSRKGGGIVVGGVMTRLGAEFGSCAGKTLKELIASGQAHFIRN